MVYNSKGRSSPSATQNKDNGRATNQKNMKQALESNCLSNLLQSMDVEKLSTPRMSMHREREQSSKLKPKSSKAENSRWNFNQEELDVSEEYRAYLHGSLAKFVQNLNGKRQQEGRGA